VTVISYRSDEPEEVISSTSWTDVESVTADIDADGEHIFWANCEYAGQNIDEIVGVRILLDGVEVAFDHFKPVLANQFRTFSPMGLKNLGLGSHNLVLQARCLDVSQTVKLRRKRLLLMKH